MLSVQTLPFGVLGLLLISSAAIADNGGAYNGPQMTGKSIPIHADRALARGDIRKSMEACYAQVAADLYQQIFHRQAAAAKSTDYVDDWRKSSTYHHEFLGRTELVYSKVNDSWAQGLKATAQRGNTFLTLEVKVVGVARWSDQAGSATVTMTYNKGDGSSDLELNLGTTLSTYGSYRRYSSFPLPVFKFDDSANDSAFDELGNIVQDRIILKNVRLGVSSHSGSAVPLYNSNTDHKTSLVLNEQKLVQCLLSKLQD